MSLDKLKKTIRQSQIEFLDLKFCDLPGFWHPITLPISDVNSQLLKTGVGVYGSSMPGSTSTSMRRGTGSGKGR